MENNVLYLIIAMLVFTNISTVVCLVKEELSYRDQKKELTDYILKNFGKKIDDE